MSLSHPPFVEPAANGPLRLAASGCPRLLVSVRSAEEALQAVAGGCDILDVKEPARGSLGMADLGTIAQVADDASPRRASRGTGESIPLSVALGEVRDWRQAAIPSLPGEVTYAKLGLSGLAPLADWQTEWTRVREQFDAAAGRTLQWIAVHYADAREAASPTADEVLEAAMQTGCAGLLVDTWRKDGRTTLDGMSTTELAALAEACRAGGLLFGVAGGLLTKDVPLLAPVRPDVIAIRTAACAGGDRTGMVDTSAVSRFRAELETWFGGRERTNSDAQRRQTTSG